MRVGVKLIGTTRVHECTIYSSRSWKLECIIIIIRRLEDIRRVEIIKVQYLEMLYTEFEVSSSNTMAVREILWCSPKIPYNNRHEHFNSMLSRNANRSFQKSSLDSTEIYCVGNMLLQTMHVWHVIFWHRPRYQDTTLLVGVPTFAAIL